MIQFWLVVLIAIIANVVVYLFRRGEGQDIVLDQKWRARMIASVCKESALDSKSLNSLFGHHFITASSMIFVPACALLGQIMEWTLFVNTNRLDSSAWLWHTGSIVKTVARAAITILLMALLFAPSLLFKHVSMVVYR